MALTAAAAQKALIALQRFGLGAKPGGPGRIGADPVAAIRGEINQPNIAIISDATLPTYAIACREGESGFERAHAVLQREVDARIGKQMSVEVGFVERLVIFWSNHFSMSVNKADSVRGTLGQLERDVIRKHVLGKFGDMLLGVIHHPAMITFLDNADSIGPNSPTGEDWGVGFNENLAREILELHTVGSGGGYTEADVTAFAKILTGWSYVRGWESDGGYNGGTAANRGRFIFRADWHEPGPIRLMGKTYPASGQYQARAVLRDIALKPATAEHIAFKLVRHFITDEPTSALVDPLKEEFLRTGGDLKAVALKLIALPAAWSTPLKKMRTPYELAIAQFRALQMRYRPDEYWAFSETLRALHQMIWECPSPEGYSDDSWAWTDPDGMTIRLDTAQLSAWLYGQRYNGNVAALARSLYDAALSPATRERVAYAGGETGSLTVLFSSPEFQRR
jgi:uncharacterized protein (DUF1800 family)